MVDALAAALLLGGINTLGDVTAAQLKLATHALYPVGRIILACYCVGGLIGAQSRQLLIGSLSGLLVGTLIAGVYVVLVPTLGSGATWLAWTLFWIAFAGCEAVLRGEIGTVGAVAQGAIAALFSGVMFHAIGGIWSERDPADPQILRALVLWTGTFVAGFVPLFWRRGPA
jgi:hypothetical protein